MRTLSITLMVALILLATSSVYAQYDYDSPNLGSEYNANPIVFGAKVGLNVSNISGADAFKSRDSKMGVHVGALAQIPVTPTILFQPELLYSQKGYVFRFVNDAGNDVQYDHRYGYLEMPLLMKMVVPVSTFKVEPFAGLTLGFLMRGKAQKTTTITNSTVIQDYDVKEHMNTIDMGITIGADVVIIEKIIAGAGYTFGFLNINKDSMPDIGTKVHNGVFKLSVGYLFN